ncbi:MAG: serine/threonine-protein kinase [Sandaracinaceae bacterium]
MTSPPSQLGPYVLGEPLGRGGFAEVFRAQHVETSEQVALKVLHRQRDPGRFLREASVLSALSHPNIVGIRECGEGADGTLYMALELVEGETLHERLRSTEYVSLEEAAWIGESLLSALDFAHARGVVHRDVKPANVLLVDRAGRVDVRLIDFGIARLAGAARLTAEGMFVGTAGYSAPEVVSGASVDPRADLWSVGIVLYEAVTGLRAYRGSMREVAVAVLRGPPPLDVLPPALRRVLERALVPVDARFPDAATMREALLRASARAPIRRTLSRSLQLGDLGVTDVSGPRDTIAGDAPGAGRSPPIGSGASTAPGGPVSAAWPATRSGMAPVAPASPPAKSGPSRSQWSLLLLGGGGALLALAVALGVLVASIVLGAQRAGAPDPRELAAYREESQLAIGCPSAYPCCLERAEQLYPDDEPAREAACGHRGWPTYVDCGMLRDVWCEPPEPGPVCGRAVRECLEVRGPAYESVCRTYGLLDDAQCVGLVSH